MPVLDAKALKKDPKGAAFLLSVLRRGPAPSSTEQDRPNPPQVRTGKRRDEMLRAAVSGRAVIDPTGFLAGERDELRHACRLERWIDDQHVVVTSLFDDDQRFVICGRGVIQVIGMRHRNDRVALSMNDQQRGLNPTEFSAVIQRQIIIFGQL